MAGITTPKKKTAAKKHRDKMYLLLDKREGWTIGPPFDSERAAKTYVDKHGYMGAGYVIFFCEKVAETETASKAVWASA